MFRSVRSIHRAAVTERWGIVSETPPDIQRLSSISTAFMKAIAQEAEQGRPLGHVGDMSPEQEGRYWAILASITKSIRSMFNQANQLWSWVTTGNKNAYNETATAQLINQAPLKAIQLAGIWAETALNVWGQERAHHFLQSVCPTVEADAEGFLQLQQRHLAAICAPK